MTRNRSNNEANRFPLLQGFLPLDRSRLPSEIIAGVTLAALAIPEVMGYTKIAGMPVITGLYTLLVPMILFALIGSSRHLVVGADSATAAMLTAGLVGIASTGSAEYVALAGVLALLASGFLLLARLVKLGFLADFLSRTALVGFLTGVGIQVALGQVAGILGLSGRGIGPIGQILHDWRDIGQINLYTLTLSLGVLVIILGTRRFSKRIPGPLIAIIGATAATWAFDLGAKGVAVLGAVPSGLPALDLPRVALSWALIKQLLPTAFGMFIVILTQSAATSRAYADRYDERFSENLDLVGLGVANIGAALSGTFVVNGSPTKTQMVDSAGGRSQLAQLVTAAIVILVLLFLTAPLAYVPEAVLAAVVFLIGMELIDIKGMKRIYFERKWEFWVALSTTVIVVVWNVQQGILLAIFLSLVAHTRHGYRPKNTVLGMDKSGKLHASPVSSPEQIKPGLLIYRFSHSMYYANTAQMSAEVEFLVKNAAPPLKSFCIDFTAIDDVDFSAAETLRALQAMLQERNIRLLFAAASDDVKNELYRSGLIEQTDNDACYASISNVVDAYVC